jgi:tetratricopeptide (TPR) repeat protein
MLKQAVADYNMALDKDPNDSLTYYNRGLAYYGLEEFEKSLADYSTAISKNPSMEAYDDFIKYFPQKRQADTRNIRGEIAQMFEDKLDLGAKVMAPVAAAPAAPFEIAAPPAAIGPAQADARDIAAAVQSQIKEAVDQWLTSWESGDMETYRRSYDPSGFRSRNMNLDQWIQYKTSVRNRSRNIQISISDLRISVQDDTAKAVFTQSYSSSLLKDKGTKTLEMKLIEGEWKIFREMM